MALKQNIQKLYSPGNNQNSYPHGFGRTPLAQTATRDKPGAVHRIGTKERVRPSIGAGLPRDLSNS